MAADEPKASNEPVVYQTKPDVVLPSLLSDDVLTASGTPSDPKDTLKS